MGDVIRGDNFDSLDDLVHERRVSRALARGLTACEQLVVDLLAALQEIDRIGESDYAKDRPADALRDVRRLARKALGDGDGS